MICDAYGSRVDSGAFDTIATGTKVFLSCAGGGMVARLRRAVRWGVEFAS